MHKRLVAGAFMALVSSLAAGAWAQAGPAAITEGRVESFRIDPHGRVAGVILQDGTIIAVPVALAWDLVRNVEIGDWVRTLPGPAQTVQLNNPRTKSVLALGPAEHVARGGGPPSREALPYARVDDVTGLERFAAEGKIKVLTHAPQGLPTGFVLQDGTQVSVAPSVAGVLRNLRPGERIRVEGLGTRGPANPSMWALTISRPKGEVLLDMTRGIGPVEFGLAPPPA